MDQTSTSTVDPVAGVRLQLVYFAWVREKVGRGSEAVQVPATVMTIADLVQWLAGRDEGYRAAFGRAEIVRAAIDHRHVQADAPIAGAKEIAFFPPVTGG